MGHVIESFKHMGFTIQIGYDDEPLNPREDWDHMGTMICFHRRYNLGDKHGLSSDSFNDWDEVEEYLIKEKGAEVILPISLYDHSGITMFVGCASGWDSGQVGYIYATREDILTWLGDANKPRKRLTKKLRERAREILEGEVEVYDQYLTGMVYEFIVLNEQGEVVESCGGFFGEEDYCKQEAISAAESAARERDGGTQLDLNV